MVNEVKNAKLYTCLGHCLHIRVMKWLLFLISSDSFGVKKNHFSSVLVLVHNQKIILVLFSSVSTLKNNIEF